MAPFITGTKVEVSSDDDGFRGAWFEATVVRTLPRVHRYTVEYDALLAEGARGAKRLRETVDWRHVRPRPQLPEKSSSGFQVGENVDAYHNDAWWTGVVTEVRGKRYAVFFAGTEEEIEFEEREVRAHREWVDGEWVDPPIAKENEQIEIGNNKGEQENEQKEIGFSKGLLVEVSSDDEGFQGSWFTATIIEPRGNDMFFLEYSDLKADDGDELLREAVHSVHIRPAPPGTRVAKFNLLEEVDAWHNDGWWVGIISKVLPGSRYLVYFKQSAEELEFAHHDLRLHFDWIRGNWFRASQVLGF